MYVVCALECSAHGRTEEGARSPGTGATCDMYVSLHINMRIETRLGSSERVAITLNHRAISPAPDKEFLKKVIYSEQSNT